MVEKLPFSGVCDQSIQDEKYINPLNTELNPTCHLLALLGAHPILYVSRIRVKPASNGEDYIKLK